MASVEMVWSPDEGDEDHKKYASPSPWREGLALSVKDRI